VKLMVYPKSFLRASRRVANPIEFYSCFISYSTKDERFPERLHRDLQSEEIVARAIT
jgi:hypothetical protein